MSGKNPFWNYDYNAAQRNREIVDSYQQANEARLDSQQSQFEASMANDRVSRIQMQLNNTINSHKKVVADYEQRLEEYKQNFFRVALHKNILFRTVRRLQEEWPDKKEFILDEMQRQRILCNQQDYRERWWNAIKDNNLAD
ncbi:hypothetical protein I9725_005056, partial [Citrobacter freundii]|nr:hypothetical protein [Citrobacter freundii]